MPKPSKPIAAMPKPSKPTAWFFVSLMLAFSTSVIGVVGEQGERVRRSLTSLAQLSRHNQYRTYLTRNKMVIDPGVQRYETIGTRDNASWLNIF